MSGANEPTSEAAALYERACSVFEAARLLRGDERSRFLDRACGDDGELRVEVDGLLATLEQGTFAALSEEGIAIARDALERVLLESESDPAPRDAWLPERVGPYRVVRLLARGGMGVVYVAEQGVPKRLIALKLVHPMYVTPARLRRFRQEAELLGRLEHPGIARIYSAGTFDAGHGEQPYFAMELVEGSDLATHVTARALPVASKLELLATVCDAVEYAHGKGVVHRDLKPDNVLVDPHEQPKVLDFGVARASESSAALSTMVTEEGDLLGTIAYMAPEQLDGVAERITPRVDVYALGAIAFELLAGRLPHDLVGLPLTAAMQILRDKEPARLGELRPELAGDLETIVGKALEKEPERRYASAADLAADLRAFVEHRPIVARPPTRLDRLRKFARRNKALVGGSAATLAAIVIGSIAALIFALRAERNAEVARTEKRLVAAGILQATQDLIERGEPWRAALMLRRAPPEHTSWAWNFLARPLPRAVPEEVALADVGWIADRHVAAASPDGGLVVYDADSMRESGRLLEDRRLAPLGTTYAEVGWWVAGKPPTDVFRIERDGDAFRIAFAHALPAVDAGWVYRATRIDADGRVVDAWADEATRQAIVFVDGAETARVSIEPRATLSGVGLSPDGRWLNYVDPNGGALRIFEAHTGALVAELGDLRVGSCPRWHWAPDGREILVFDADRRLTRIDLESSEIVERFDAIQTDECDGGDISADGSLFALSPLLRPLELYELPSGRRLATWAVELLAMGGHRVKISPDGERIIVSGKDRGACVIDLDPEHDPSRLLDPLNDPRVTTYRGHEAYVYDLAISPDGRLAASSSVAERSVHVWELAGGTLVARLAKPAEGSSADDNRGQLLAFTPDGRRLLATSRQGFGPIEILEWDLVTGEERKETPPLEPTARHVQALDRFLERFGPAPPMRLGRKTVIVEDGTALSLQQPARERVPVGERWSVFVDNNEESAIDLSHDGRRIAVGAARTVRIYDRATVTRLANFACDTYAVAWSPDDRLIAAGGVDGRIRLFDAELKTEVLDFPAHDDYVFAVAWTPDGTRLVSASGDATVRVWDPRLPAEREADRDSYEARLESLRALGTEELERRFANATNAAERGAIVRVALERRSQ